jgi:hypothetical protein
VNNTRQNCHATLMILTRGSGRASRNLHQDHHEHHPAGNESQQTIFHGARGQGSDTAYPARNTAAPHGTLTLSRPRLYTTPCSRRMVREPAHPPAVTRA